MTAKMTTITRAGAITPRFSALLFALCGAISVLLYAVPTQIRAEGGDKLSNAPLPAQAETAPAKPQTIDELMSNAQFMQLCSIEVQFSYFQRVCLVRESNAQAVSDAWVIFRARNREALDTLRQACRSSQRWPALANKLMQDEQNANVLWHAKPREQVDTFCQQLPQALANPEMSEGLRRFANQIRIAPPATPPAK
jgi:hypothetical protein